MFPICFHGLSNKVSTVSCFSVFNGKGFYTKAKNNPSNMLIS